MQRQVVAILRHQHMRLQARPGATAADRQAGSLAILYRYSPDRKEAYPQEHLRGFKGIQQADGYGGITENLPER